MVTQARSAHVDDVVVQVEAYHEVYGELISAALAVAGGGAGTNGLERPGDGAAEQVTTTSRDSPASTAQPLSL